MTTVSALTIASGREAHLKNVIRGFQTQTHPPVELIIGVMQDSDYTDLPTTDFPIRQIRITGPELPLAAARNAVADAATGDVLVFVDVDCMPDPEFIAGYLACMEGQSGLFMGEVLYLPSGATAQGLDFDRFAGMAVRHSDRQGPPAAGLERCPDYRCFWSLNFAMHRAGWQAGPGFDERFTGYGGEDTDFGRALSEAGIPIWWIKGGRVYHQYHPHCMPPVHHLHSVLRNTEVFAAKWGHRTMEHWLYAFQLMGLIRNTASGLEVLREPAAADIALCEQQGHMPYANSRRVIDHLHQVAADRRHAPDRVAELRRAQDSLLMPAAE
ncbi:glycosyltransferase family 2 protein [Paracoccus liaowanqingii]|uniref:Glycosyltransferase family 2 protein n=1 Tax=Paracoccus liaowanqingii TaxID=2560053 RepID=A0A4P7HLD9_9RHOB|nr:glycosyltransferase family 2 protein [Paracoccus liaowanqingii]QBX34986.1 glycosyltransferase family 2 protein [Paracoccus liaowanqingii]